MNMDLRKTLAIVGILLSGGVAWAAEMKPSASAPPPATTGLRPYASFQEIMLTQVNPSATFLWGAVSTQATDKGTVQKRPHTDAEWLEVRHQALVLIEAGNLLLMQGRPVVARGAKVKDAEQPGILGPEAIRKTIAADRPAFEKLVHALQDSVKPALAAIDRKDATGLEEAGGAIDEACEACHLKYWYPQQ